jgi:hypothetical protein
MGAAAVFETAAETPPTVIASQHWDLENSLTSYLSIDTDGIRRR